MRVVVATVQTPFVRGGAEIHAEGLRNSLIAEGHEAEIVAIPFKWYPPEQVLPQMLACRLMELTESDGIKIDMVVGLKFPSYLIPHPRKVLWILHQHRPAYDLWAHSLGDLASHPNGSEVRSAIQQADLQAFTETKKIFANSQNVARRLRQYCQIDSVPLYHPPLGAELFYSAASEPYLFYPSRFSPNKRQLLVLEALACTRCPVKVRFASSSNHSTYTDELRQAVQRLKLENRVEFLGDINEEEKRRLYAHALAVVYPPVDEDYGYVTLEAMLSSKPVITCRDSGGPLEFVIDKETGLVADSTPKSLACAMDEVWDNRQAARMMGATGRDHFVSLGITWPKVVESLLS